MLHLFRSTVAGDLGGYCDIKLDITLSAMKWLFLDENALQHLSLMKQIQVCTVHYWISAVVFLSFPCSLQQLLNTLLTRNYEPKSKKGLRGKI